MYFGGLTMYLMEYVYGDVINITHASISRQR